MKSLFIVVEGIDGSGTSTQSELLKKHFLAQNQKAIVSPEPTNGIIGKLLREFLQKKQLFKDSKKFDQQMAYLFAADRYYHLYNDTDGIFKLINDNYHVITTRYYFSSLAYNCHKQEEFELVWGLNRFFPDPDLVIYLDISVDIALERLSDRSRREIYENRTELLRVKANYEQIFSQYKGKLLKLDATDDRDNITKKIIELIKNQFS